MDRRTFESGISLAWNAVQTLNLGETFSNGGALEVDTGFRNLILSSDTAYEDIFLYGLKNSNYNFLLSDHSFFQFSWFKENDIRFAYYPNPYLGSDANNLLTYKKRLELFQSELVDYEEFLQLLGDAVGMGRIPVIRYENAPDQYKEMLHPCSHLHIGLHGDDRWPVRRILTPHAFTLIILRNYYGTIWRESEVDETGKFLKLDAELRKARATSSILPTEQFSAPEEGIFHFL
jgi:hypothetical protein